jgi:hypothetical protein
MVRFVSELQVNMSTLYKDRMRKREQLTCVLKEEEQSERERVRESK